LKSCVAKSVIQFKALLRYVYDAVFVNLNDKYDWQLYIHENQTKNHYTDPIFYLAPVM